MEKLIIDNESYHKLEGISSTAYKALLHGKLSRKRTKSLELGGALHPIVEGYLTGNPVKILQAKNRRNTEKYLHELRAAQEEHGEAVLLVPKTEYEQLTLALEGLGEAMLPLLKFDWKLEQTFVATLGELKSFSGATAWVADLLQETYADDMVVRARPDAYAVDSEGVHILDFKSTTTNSIVEMERDTVKYDYVFSLNWYGLLLETYLKMPVVSRKLLFLPKNPAPPVVVEIKGGAKLQSWNLNGYAASTLACMAKDTMTHMANAEKRGFVETEFNF